MGREARAKRPQTGAAVATLGGEEYWELRARAHDVDKAQRQFADAQELFKRTYSAVAEKHGLPNDGALSLQWNDDTKQVAVKGAQ